MTDPMPTIMQAAERLRPVADEEWFSRKHLSVVEVQEVWEEHGQLRVTIRNEFGTCEVYGDHFLTDYVRNETLTVELLKREGWAADPTNPQCMLWQWGPDDHVAWTPNTEPDDVPWSNGTFDVWDHDGKEHVFTLPWPAKLVDLFRSLRYGVGTEFVMNAHTWPIE